MNKNAVVTKEESVAIRFRFGEFEFDNALMALTRNGSRIDLDAIPLAALNLLLENSGQAVTKEEFLDEVWSGRIVEDGSLTVAISKLRKALSPNGLDYIRTIQKVGYQFAAKVEFEIIRKPALRVTLEPGQHAPHTRGWTLDKLIGTGGFGEAWLAHDASERQRVFKYATSSTALRALKRELASFRVIESLKPGAPGLLPVLDTQFEKTPFYISTPYRGRSLDEWADAGQSERLRVVAKVARILVMAHSVGVLHLDVKPKNILVDHDGESTDPDVHLIDFGNAKLANPESAIQLGVTLGQTISPDHPDVGSTPVYLAPEVLAGEVATTQSDIYSLGVVLYQAWVGDYNKPIATGWEAGVGDALVREDIAAATSGDPARRLASVEELAQRLENLASRRVALRRKEQEARDNLRVQQELERTRARRPWVIAAITSMAVGLAASIGLFARSETLRQQAESNLFVANALNGFLADDLFSQADPNVGGKATISLRAALDKATKGLSERFGESPELLTSINATLGQLYYRTTNYKEAASYYRSALHVQGADSAQHSSLQVDYAKALMLSGQLDEATMELDAADLQLAQLEATHPLRLKASVVRARLLLLRTDWDALLPLVDEIEGLLANDPQAEPDVVNGFYAAALDGHMATEKLQRAKALAGQWLDYLNASEGFEGSYIQSVAYQYLGRLNLNTDEPEEALRFALAAEEGLKAFVEETDLVRLTNIQTIAVANSFLGRNDEAIAAMRSVVEGQIGRLGANHPYTLISHSDLGGMLSKGGYFHEAVDVLAPAYAQAMESHGAGHFSTLMVGYNFSEALGGSGQHKRALVVLSGIAEEGAIAFPEGHQWGARVELMFGKLAVYREDWSAAVDRIGRAIPMLDAAAGVDQETKAEASRLLQSVKLNLEAAG